MKRAIWSIAWVLIGLFFSGIPAEGETITRPLPRNISIEVEFREAGRSTSRGRLLSPYQTRSSSQYVKQSLVVTDGLTGTIRVGEDVPYIEYYSRYLFDHGYVETIETAFREVGTKLVVTPRIRGNYIEVSLTPQVSYLSGAEREVVNMKELTTTVIAANGQSISIGGLIKDEAFRENFFKTNTASNLDIILTPRIQ